MNNLRKSKKKNMKTKKAHSEVKRILNSNIQRLDLKESSDIKGGKMKLIIKIWVKYLCGFMNLLNTPSKWRRT